MSRKIKVILAAILITGAILGLGLSIINEQAKPEPQITVYKYKKDIESDEIIESKDLASVQFPESLVNKNYVTNKEEVIGKILVEDVKEDNYLMKEQFAKRGLSNELYDLSAYWKFGIETTNIENFIGLQLERGESYQLVFRNREIVNSVRKSGWISEVIVVDLIDSTGKKVFEIKDEKIQTVVLAIQTESAMIKVIEKKDDVSFELIKAPNDYSGSMIFNKSPRITEEILD